MRYRSKLWAGMTWAVVLVLGATSWTELKAADRVKPVPLGGSLSEQTGDQYFGVYVPTRFGGALTVKSTAGKIASITGPDGKPRSNGGEVGTDQHGWYTFQITGAEKAKFSVETSFVQTGQSARLPWNFYYWPTKADSIHEPWAGGNGRVDTSQVMGDDILLVSPGSYIAPGQDIVRAGANGLLETRPAAGDTSTWFPNLYDDLTFLGADNNLYSTPSPMLKYDQLLGSSARNWEAANSQNQDIQRWPGHCLGGAVASILLNEPRPAPGTGLTSDELKALWAELGENHYNHRIGDYAADIPAGPPRPGWDPTDAYAPRFHAMLENHIRGEKKSLLGNLRAFPPRGTANEVWNHGIGKYVAAYKAIPGKGERSVKVEMELHANSGSNLNNDDNKPRIVKYEYTLGYGLDGRVDATGQIASDWISVGGEAMFCPLNILEVVETRWQGHNPYVTEANVRSLDLANGGGGRFTGAAPQFRPVGSYEAGRRPQFAGRTNDAEAASPRRGLFRLFGR